LGKNQGSTDRGTPEVDFSVVREEGGECIQPSGVGEITAIGDNILPVHYNDPDALQKKFSNGTLYSSNLSTVDEESLIFIIDRKSYFIRSCSPRVSSNEIETCVFQISNVVAVAAAGIPDE
jgi:acyl-CoA synthetase (AMP-forming)/AMP-acid ligase II